MSQYWSTENVVQIGEEQVSIPCENGLNFEIGSVARKVGFEIPKESVEFMSGKDSYLEFDADIIAPTNQEHTRLMLDPAGAGMMVQNIRIYDESRGNLIEELNEYNQVVAMRHDYDKDVSKKQSRALLEAGGQHTAENSGTRGSTKSDMANISTNPWFKKITDDQNADYDYNVQKSSAHCCVPIHSGVFTGQIFPNMLTGLYVEIDLMPAPRIVRQVDSVVRDRRRTLNPRFWGARKSADNTVISPWTQATADPVNGVWLAKINGVEDPAHCPFVVGETINFVSSTDAAGLDANITDSPATGYTSPTIASITVDPAQGNRVFLEFTADALQGANAGGRGADVTRDVSAVFSTFVSESASYPVKYNVKNLNLVVQKIIMDPAYKSGMLQKAREGGSIEFDIFSYTNYKNSMLASDRQTSFLIHAANTKAKSCLILPTDATVYSDKQLVSSTGTYEVTQDVEDTVLNSARPGISGCCDFLSEYQFQIDGKLVPSRPVSTRKISTRKSIDAFHIYELEKLLANAGIPPHSFNKYMESFALGRGFAVNSGVMDLRNRDLSVQLNYSEATAPTKNKMFSTFVFHLRRVMIKNGATTVVM